MYGASILGHLKSNAHRSGHLMSMGEKIGLSGRPAPDAVTFKSQRQGFVHEKASGLGQSVRANSSRRPREVTGSGAGRPDVPNF